jgi:hypothetical protein
MREGSLKYYIIMVILFGTTMCRKPYEPPAIKANNHFLAIDGVINTGANSFTSFRITRSVSLIDTLPYIPELNASVKILSSGGPGYPLTDTGSNGVYVSSFLNLDPTQRYQLAVTTSDGNKYISDLVTPKVSPPIDSVSLQLGQDLVAGVPAVTVYISTHDETNNTRYYRWDYTETWQHTAAYETNWGVKNGFVFPLSQDSNFFNCWTTAQSTDILLGSSIALSADVITQAPIAKFLKDDPKMDVEYSMLIRQYPLDPESYRYWLSIQQNSQGLGGLYDLQPSQITGNIHSVTNPNNPVLGYVTASSIQEKRIFITNGELPGWKSDPVRSCPTDTVLVDPLNTLVYNYRDTSFTIFEYISGSGNPPAMVVTKKNCVDCRFEGGIAIKPSFWE